MNFVTEIVSITIARIKRNLILQNKNFAQNIFVQPINRARQVYLYV